MLFLPRRKSVFCERGLFVDFDLGYWMFEFTFQAESCFWETVIGTSCRNPLVQVHLDLRCKKNRAKGRSTVMKPLENIRFSSFFSQYRISSHPIPPSFSPPVPIPPLSFFHTLIVETYRKINFHYPVERPNVSPLCLIDDAQTPSHTPLLFIAPQSWSPFSGFLWQIITGDVIAIPPGE